MNKLEIYYVAYFDILGYKAYFNENTDYNKFLNEFINLVDCVKEELIKREDYVPFDFKFHMFSDNFIFFLRKEKDDIEYELNVLSSLCFLISYLQVKIYSDYGLLIRGAITKGLFYVNDMFVFGPALIKAVDMEYKVKYPRIIVDNDFDVAKFDMSLWKGLLKKDDDDIFFVDYFTIWETFSFFSVVKQKVKQDVEKYIVNTQNLKFSKEIVEKYMWVYKKFNEACEITTVNGKVYSENYIPNMSAKINGKDE